MERDGVMGRAMEEDEGWKQDWILADSKRLCPLSIHQLPAPTLLLGPINNLICRHVTMRALAMQLPSLLDSNETVLAAVKKKMAAVRETAVARSTYRADLKRQRKKKRGLTAAGGFIHST